MACPQVSFLRGGMGSGSPPDSAAQLASRRRQATGKRMGARRGETSGAQRQMPGGLTFGGKVCPISADARARRKDVLRRPISQ